MTDALIHCQLCLHKVVLASREALEAAESVQQRPPVTIADSRTIDGDRLRMSAYVAEERLRLSRFVVELRKAFVGMDAALRQLTNASEEDLLQRIATLEEEESRLEARFLQQYADACQLSDLIDERIRQGAIDAFTS